MTCVYVRVLPFSLVPVPRHAAAVLSKQCQNTPLVASEFFKEYAKVKTIGQGSYGKAILCEHRDTLLKCVVKQFSVSDRKVR